jgi:hypothetical protein
MNDLENMWKETVETLLRRPQFLPIRTGYKKRNRRRVETVFVPRFRTGQLKHVEIVPTSRPPRTLISRINPVIKLPMKHHVIKTCGGIYPRIFHFGTRWR